MPPEATLALPLATVRCQASTAAPAGGADDAAEHQQPKHRAVRDTRRCPQPAHQQPPAAS